MRACREETDGKEETNVTMGRKGDKTLPDQSLHEC